MLKETVQRLSSNYFMLIVSAQRLLTNYFVLTETV